MGRTLGKQDNYNNNNTTTADIKKFWVLARVGKGTDPGKCCRWSKSAWEKGWEILALDIAFFRTGWVHQKYSLSSWELFNHE
jgi:hypothetical protein